MIRAAVRMRLLPGSLVITMRKWLLSWLAGSATRLSSVTGPKHFSQPFPSAWDGHTDNGIRVDLKGLAKIILAPLR